MKRKSSKLYVGMDVHKDSIDIATAEEGGEVRHFGRVGGDMKALSTAVRKLESLGRALVFVYEAGPCGYTIYRWLVARGHACWVVAPSNTPRRVRDRIKTDRRDCLKLAGLARAGELEPIYVPDVADEAMRDLVRAREDAVAVQRQVRHRLGALLLRNDIRYAGKTRLDRGAPALDRALGSCPMRPSASPSRSTCRGWPRPASGCAGSPRPSSRSCPSGAGARWWPPCRPAAASSSSTGCASWPNWATCRALPTRAS